MFIILSLHFVGRRFIPSLASLRFIKWHVTLWTKDSKLEKIDVWSILVSVLSGNLAYTSLVFFFFFLSISFKALCWVSKMYQIVPGAQNGMKVQILFLRTWVLTRSSLQVLHWFFHMFPAKLAITPVPVLSCHSEWLPRLSHALPFPGPHSGSGNDGVAFDTFFKSGKNPDSFLASWNSRVTGRES